MIRNSFRFRMPAVPVWLQDISTSEALSPFSQRLVVANTCISTHALPLQHCEARCLVAAKVTTDIRRGQRVHLTVCGTSANILTCPLYGVVSKVNLGQDVHLVICGTSADTLDSPLWSARMIVAHASYIESRKSMTRDTLLLSMMLNSSQLPTSSDEGRSYTPMSLLSGPPACCIKVTPRQ